MKARKTKDIIAALQRKGFVLNPAKDHHEYYYLYIDGKKQAVYTYFSNGAKEYPPSLMSKIKRQLMFTDTEKAELFFDCPMTKEQYVEMLRNNGTIK